MGFGKTKFHVLFLNISELNNFNLIVLKTFVQTKILTSVNSCNNQESNLDWISIFLYANTHVTKQSDGHKKMSPKKRTFWGMEPHFHPLRLFSLDEVVYNISLISFCYLFDTSPCLIVTSVCVFCTSACKIMNKGK